MMSSELINKTAEYVKATMVKEGTGHDWFHIERVWHLAKAIQAKEGGDLEIVELAALLHDIADWKFSDGDLDAGAKVSREWLTQINAPVDVIDHVCEIVGTLSYKGAGVPDKMKTIEGQIVQDADRLDAIGAIGIARCFAYGGHKNRPLYDPEVKLVNHATFEEYKNKEGTAFNHFYEKLFLLKDRLNTQAAKKIAQGRHEFMQEFVDRFLKEWNGQD
ncbi:MAG: HD domain-containing protein [Patescibacteria group bacterium]|nr:HD domain-containing protein [Patescibacteria group bacterium]